MSAPYYDLDHGLVIDDAPIIWRRPIDHAPPPRDAVMVQLHDPDQDDLVVEWAEYQPGRDGEAGGWTYAGTPTIGVGLAVVLWAYPPQGLPARRVAAENIHALARAARREVA